MSRAALRRIVPCPLTIYLSPMFYAGSKKSLREQVQTGFRLVSVSAFLERGFLKMGYYSDVMISMKKKDYDEMILEIEKSDFSEPEKRWILENLFRNSSPLYPVESEFFNEYVLLSFYGIKWYDDVRSLEFVKNYIFNLNEFQFIRIGENYDDFEEKIEGDDFNLQILRLERRLIVDY